ncbi:MAG: ATPase, T2SS/T4P/T4SS family [Tepidisphaeraceae bacterium]|jgi:general secretion pathway protein E
MSVILDHPSTADTREQSLAIAKAAGVAVVEDLSGLMAAAEFIEKVPIAFARSATLLGLAAAPRLPACEGRVILAVADLTDYGPIQVVARFLGRPVLPVLAQAEQIATQINHAYEQRTGQTQAMIERLDRQEVLAEVRAATGREDLLDVATRAPVIKLVNLILFEAVQAAASDVHIQPYEDSLVIRLRIDGVLYDSFSIPKAAQEEIISRVKVMGRMNIAEKRLPQDGRATVQVGDRGIDLRIATLPTTFGERAVIRLLDKGTRLYSAAELGMEPATLARFRRLIAREHGMILATGPTGSGKTTTLYAALRDIDRKGQNILTLEDPIEYRLEGISQTQVNDKKGITFASGLRSVLRQDPDIIMVGEIRDHETAVMAIQSALTGHLVLSTLHTNDAASAVTRLLDLGIEPYLLASSLIGVVAQRLVRRVCRQCAAPVQPTAEELAQLGLNGGRGEGRNLDSLQAGAGCPACRNTGYRGRIGLFELLVVDDALRRHIQARANSTDIKSAAISGGMSTLRDDGVAKALAGATTIDEVVRVTFTEDEPTASEAT